MKPTPARAVLNWSAGFAIAAVTLAAFPRRFAQATAWGPNEGWQREIAIWNLGLLTIIWKVRRPGTDIDRALISGFSVLSSLFAVNHLVAGLRSPRSWGHWVAAVGNIAGLGVGAGALTRPRQLDAP